MHAPRATCTTEEVGAGFPDTQWSQIVALHDLDDPRREVLLGRLIARYWKPAYHYIRSLRRLSREDTEDLTQQFFTGLLARRSFDRLTPERGSFRGFMKTSLRNFVVSAHRSAAARPFSFRFDEAEAEWAEHAELPPDEAFDRAWIQTVLRQAVTELEGELLAKNKRPQFEMFRSYCLDDDEVSYRQLAERHGVSEDDVRNRLREARARIREILRRLMREYLGPDEEVESELGFVLRR